MRLAILGFITLITLTISIHSSSNLLHKKDGSFGFHHVKIILEGKQIKTDCLTLDDSSISPEKKEGIIFKQKEKCAVPLEIIEILKDKVTKNNLILRYYTIKEITNIKLRNVLNIRWKSYIEMKIVSNGIDCLFRIYFNNGDKKEMESFKVILQKHLKNFPKAKQDFLTSIDEHKKSLNEIENLTKESYSLQKEIAELNCDKFQEEIEHENNKIYRNREILRQVKRKWREYHYQRGMSTKYDIHGDISDGLDIEEDLAKSDIRHSEKVIEQLDKKKYQCKNRKEKNKKQLESIENRIKSEINTKITKHNEEIKHFEEIITLLGGQMFLDILNQVKEKGTPRKLKKIKEQVISELAKLNL